MRDDSRAPTPLTRRHRFLGAQLRVNVVARWLTRQWSETSASEDPRTRVAALGETINALASAVSELDRLGPSEDEKRTRPELVSMLAHAVERWLDRPSAVELARAAIIYFDESWSPMDAARAVVGHRVKHEQTYAWPRFDVAELDEIATALAAAWNASPRAS